MNTSRLSPLLVLALIAALFVSLIGTATPVDAAARGSITIHSRICPTTIPTGSDIFDLCHGNPGPDGARFKVDNRQSKYIDSHGNVSFSQVTAGDHKVVLTSDWQPNEFLGMRVFCTNLVTGSGSNQAGITYGNQASFWVYLAPGGKLVCDVYFLPESGR